MKILLSAYSCDPSKGSEPGYGFNWAVGLEGLGFEVVCLTRSIGKEAIEESGENLNLRFEYLDLSFGLEKLFSFSRPTMYLHYLLWQWLAFKRAKRLHKLLKFDIAHHVTWGSLQLGSLMYRLNIPFIFGPVGGGQVAPAAFKKYFKEYWDVEVKREITSKWLMRVNPGINKMVREATVILASNKETQNLAYTYGATNCKIVLDAALPTNFFPETMPEKEVKKELKLLWIGRLLPRKGVLLVTEVMQQLKGYAEISLTIVGDGEMRDYLENDIKDRSLHNVNYVGSVPYEKVKEYYATHDLFFFTSLRDSGGSQLFEAMAFGLPAVTLALHGQDAMVNEKVGIKCPASDPRETVVALRTAILTLNNDRDRLKKMSLEAFEHAKKQTWAIKIKTVVDNYYVFK